MSPHVLSPGEPELAKAILQASRFNGAGYVHRWEGVPGWHVGQSIPKGVPVYFRVSVDCIWVRTACKHEYRFGRIVDGTIVPDGKPPA